MFAYLGALAGAGLRAGNPALFDRTDPAGRTRRVFGIFAAAGGVADARFEACCR